MSALSTFEPFGYECDHQVTTDLNELHVLPPSLLITEPGRDLGGQPDQPPVYYRTFLMDGHSVSAEIILKPFYFKWI